jgi:autotransporter-associated beta strand protein
MLVSGNLNVNAVGDIVVGDSLGDASGSTGGLTKLGSGTVYLNRQSTYTGATTVRQGTLALNTATALGGQTAVTVQNGATLLANVIASLGGSNPANNPAVTIQQGGLVMASNGVASWIGKVNLQGGTLSSGTPWTSGSHRESWVLGGDVTVSGGRTSTISSTAMALGASGGVTFNVEAGSTLNVTGTFASAAETTDGDNGLIKTGEGAMVLSGKNTSISSTTVSAGSLELAKGSSMAVHVASTGSSTQFLGSGTLVMNGTLAFDLSDVTGDGSWNVISNDLHKSYGSDFAVTFGYQSQLFAATNNAGVWSYIAEGLGTATFTQSTGVLQFTATAVPEPSSMMLGMAGAFGLLAYAWRKRK